MFAPIKRVNPWSADRPTDSNATQPPARRIIGLPAGNCGRLLLYALLLNCALAVPLFAQQVPVVEKTLANGMKLLLVARHDDPGAGDAFEKGPRGKELPSPGPLGDIAAHGDERRIEPAQVGQELTDERRVLAAEVQIRDVGNAPHDPFRLKRGSQCLAFVV